MIFRMFVCQCLSLLGSLLGSLSFHTFQHRVTTEVIMTFRLIAFRTT